jgi:signal transduction histidine kinase
MLIYTGGGRISDQLSSADHFSGLGLSIIKRMIEKDQGYLEVFSEPGAGTEFKAYLKEQAVI